MHEAIRGSALEIIAAAGHLSNVERPDEFNRIAATFLASLPR
jgi:pimeloyl-ACP methyl ester carboxylesterase